MAICRWSSSCDLYCYEDTGGGFTTHVAGSGTAGKIQTFNDPDLKSLLARLNELRATGYRLPDDVIAKLEQELSASG